jgi:hypothetical protein
MAGSRRKKSAKSIALNRKLNPPTWSMPNLARAVPEIRYLFLGPSNDHELAIARLVDQLDAEGRLNLAEGAEAVAALDFVMSKDDWKFLGQYTHWRMANPIVK